MSTARVYIGRLSNYARDRDVEKFFKGFGRIKEIMIKNGYCFVVSSAAKYCLVHLLKILVLALDLEGVHDVKLHHPSSSVATSNQ